MAGELLSAVIGPEGWFARLQFSGLPTGGSYIGMGFGANSSILSNSSSVVFNLTSSGYDISGNPIETQRKVFGTTGVRKSYPNITIKDEYLGSSGVVLPIALSEYVCQKDRNVSVIINAPFYSGISGANQTGTISVTNSSQLAYPKVIGNHTWVPFETVTGTTASLRFMALQYFGQSGSPVRTVKFIVRDNHNNVQTGYVNSLTVDSRIPDAVPVVEYVWDYSLLPFSGGDIISSDVVVYPWIGDSGSILDTRTTNYSQAALVSNPTPWPATFFQFYDKNNVTGHTVVFVNSTTGSDVSGVAVDFTGFNINSPPPAYRTISSGAMGIQNFNNANRGRNNAGGGIIVLDSGNHIWVGTTQTNNASQLYLTISGTSLASRDTIRLTGQAGSSHLNTAQRIKLDHLTIANNSISMFDSMTSGLWVNNCFLASTGSNGLVTFYFSTRNYHTFNTIRATPEGLQQFTPGDNTQHILIRGNTFVSGWNNVSQIYTFIGNKLDLSATSSQPSVYFTDNNVSTQVVPSGVPILFGCNQVLRKYSSAAGGQNVLKLRSDNAFAASGVNSHVAVYQNVFEGISSPQNVCMLIGADQVKIDTDNILIWNNDILGFRNNLCYNSTGTFAGTRLFWSYKNNMVDSSAVKTDTFGGEGPPTGTRTGNFPFVHGVGLEGNIIPGLSGISAGTNDLVPDFGGINSLYPNAGAVGVVGQANIYGFVNRLAYSGGATDTIGSGNYSLLTNSSGINFGRTLLFAYDISGNPRSTFDVGAYSYYAAVIAQLRRRRIILI